MRLVENDGQNEWPVKNMKAAEKMIGGLDLSMATVDCDFQDYKVINSKGKIIFHRPRVRC